MYAVARQSTPNEVQLIIADDVRLEKETGWIMVSQGVNTMGFAVEYLLAMKQIGGVGTKPIDRDADRAQAIEDWFLNRIGEDHIWSSTQIRALGIVYHELLHKGKT